MTKTKKINAEQTWAIIMVGLPAMLLPRLAPDLSDAVGIQLLYAGILGGVGGGIGALFYAVTKKKSVMVRLLGVLGVIVTMAGALYVISQMTEEAPEQDVTEVGKEWITQQIGHIEFDAPERLVEETGDFALGHTQYYEKVKCYSDGSTGRRTLFIETVLKQDTHSIAYSFFVSLNGLLEKSDVDPTDMNFNVIYADEEELSVAFKYKSGADSLGGFGYMFLNGTTMESLWLVPKEKGFSDEYIEEFEFGIFPDTY